MQIDLNRLKLQINQKQEFRGTLPDLGFLGSEWSGNLLEPAQVELRIFNAGEELIASGYVEAICELSCARCLEMFPYIIKSDLDFIISRQQSSEAEMVALGDGIIDLRDKLAEAVLLTLPFIPLCREDCKGLCPGCGCNKNIEPCQCQDQEYDIRWAKLKDLL